MSKFKVQNSKFKTRKPFAKKSLGQNFLVDRNNIEKIISALNPKENETIIEIGAGRGALTEYLVESGANIIAIEIDRDLIPLLEERFRENKNFQLLEQDVLTIDFNDLFKNQKSKTEDQKTKLVANLPYYISTAVLQHLINYREQFSEMILMLQKEVVERITAESGNKERGFLTVLIENYFQTQKLFDVPPNAFLPVPKVTSAVMRLQPNVLEENFDEVLFRKIVSQGFLHKRKTIQNNLKIYQDSPKILEQCDIDPKRRAETLSLEEWKMLSERIGVGAKK